MLRSKFQRQQRQSNHRAEEAGDGPYSHEQWVRQWPNPKSRAVDSWRTGLIQSLSQFGIFQVLPSAVALPGVVLIEIWIRENSSTFPVTTSLSELRGGLGQQARTFKNSFNLQLPQPLSRGEEGSGCQSPILTIPALTGHWGSAVHPSLADWVFVFVRRLHISISL